MLESNPVVSVGRWPDGEYERHGAFNGFAKRFNAQRRAAVFESGAKPTSVPTSRPTLGERPLRESLAYARKMAYRLRPWLFAHKGGDLAAVADHDFTTGRAFQFRSLGRQINGHCGCIADAILSVGPILDSKLVAKVEPL